MSNQEHPYTSVSIEEEEASRFRELRDELGADSTEMMEKLLEKWEQEGRVREECLYCDAEPEDPKEHHLDEHPDEVYDPTWYYGVQ